MSEDLRIETKYGRYRVHSASGPIGASWGRPPRDEEMRAVFEVEAEDGGPACPPLHEYPVCLGDPAYLAERIEEAVRTAAHSSGKALHPFHP